MSKQLHPKYLPFIKRTLHVILNHATDENIPVVHIFLTKNHVVIFLPVTGMVVVIWSLELQVPVQSVSNTKAEG